MSLVTTARLTDGQRRRLSCSTSAVLPLPTGPAIPTRYALMVGSGIYRHRSLRSRLSTEKLSRFTWYSTSEQKISLRQRQLAGGLAGQQLAVSAYFIRLGIHIDSRRRGVVDHVFLADGAAATYGDGPLFQESLNAGIHGASGDESQRSGGRRAAEGPEHGPVKHRLRGGNGGVGVPHHAPGDEAAFDNNLRFGAEHRGLPEHQV